MDWHEHRFPEATQSSSLLIARRYMARVYAGPEGTWIADIIGTEGQILCRGSLPTYSAALRWAEQHLQTRQRRERTRNG